MESQQQQQSNQQVQQQQQNDQDSNNSGKGGGGSYLCRQSSTRWTPTTDQIRILKELYYNNGVRSPSAEQIQRISARLRQYGKIEGKNVFYWFQNHKARERQKKRFTSDNNNHHHHNVLPSSAFQQQQQQIRPPSSAAAWKPDDHSTTTFHHNNNKHFPTSNINTPHPGVNYTAACSSSSSPGVFAVGQMGGGFGSYGGGGGSTTMEKSFRDCSLSAGGSGGNNGTISHNFGWVAGVDHPYASSNYSTYTNTSSNLYNDKRNFIMESLEEEQDQDDDDDDDDDDGDPEIETLPLFPMHNEDINNGRFCNMKPSSDGYYGTTTTTGWYRSDDGYGRARTSLELSLSYAGKPSYPH